MPETCETCECGLDEAEPDVQKTRVPSNIAVEENLREHILQYLPGEEHETFIKQVTVCPEEIKVVYSDHS